MGQHMAPHLSLGTFSALAIGGTGCGDRRARAASHFVEVGRVSDVAYLGSVGPHQEQVPVTLFGPVAVDDPALTPDFLRQFRHVAVFVFRRSRSKCENCGQKKGCDATTFERYSSISVYLPYVSFNSTGHGTAFPEMIPRGYGQDQSG